VNELFIEFSLEFTEVQVGASVSASGIFPSYSSIKVGRLQADSDRSNPKSGTAAGPSTTVRTGVFARRGEIWTLSLDGSLASLKDIKGLRYIQHLLQHPGQDFHVFDILREPAAPDSIGDATDKAGLLANPTISVGGLGDAGEMLDARAKDEYRRRLRELREEMEEHRERGNHQRAEELEGEIDFIVREISRAVGLSGRDRRAGSAAERARLNVTRAIKTAIQKIGEHQEELARFLDERIRTGMFCRYSLDGGYRPRGDFRWMKRPRCNQNPRLRPHTFSLLPRTCWVLWRRILRLSGERPNQPRCMDCSSRFEGVRAGW